MKIEEVIEVLECIYPSQKQIVTGEYPQVAESLDIAIELLKKQLNGGWVPVSERLPKVHKRYLVNMKHKSLNETFIDCRYFYSDYQFEYRDDFERRNWEVIAWQPLPQPYKEVENE